MSIRYNLIAAACENLGIGKNNQLPWRLKSEMNYFTNMTTQTKDPNKQNIVVMGRKTWDSIPAKYKPLPNRINFILSRSNINLNLFDECYTFTTWEQLINTLKDTEFKNLYESIWIIGGSSLYKEAMQSEFFYRLYLTEIKKEYDCDTFFPPLGNNLQQITDSKVPHEVQEENGISFQYKIYENMFYKK